MAKSSIHICDIVKQADVTMIVRLRGVNQWRVRMWISRQLIQFGMWLIYGHAEFYGGELPEIDTSESPIDQGDCRLPGGGYQPTAPCNREVRDGSPVARDMEAGK